MTKITAVLNIGLDWTDKGGEARQHDIRTVLGALRRFGVLPLTCDTVRSDSEPTLVIRAIIDADCIAIHQASAALEQDCIAVWNIDDEEGALIGPRADAWGRFDPDKFLTHTGDRLASVLKAERN